MKYLSTFAFVLLVSGATNAFAQSSVSGIVRDADTDRPIAGVEVKSGAAVMSVYTDEAGSYTLTLNEERAELFFFFPGYQLQVVEVQVEQGKTLPDVLLKPSAVARMQEMPSNEVTISSDDLDGDVGGQSISGLLQSSKDVFVSAVSYTFSPARFQIRGYDSDYTEVYMNGIITNDFESGYGSWGSWGGLNDAMRNQQVSKGIAPTDFAFGGIGGSTYINTRPSQARVQTKVSYAATNRTYNNRLMGTFSSGLMDNGLAVLVSASRRWAQEAYVPGTNYDAWAYFFAIEKKISNQHSVSFTTFNAPVKRGMQGVSTDEAKELVGDNYYNPNWGYQNGKVRNAKVRNQYEPTLILNHYWDFDEDLRITTTLGYTFGTYQTTSLNWYDAQDPRPDYYRKLPSYWAESAPADVVDAYKQAFGTDPQFSQINWNALYQTNYSSYNAQTNELRSKYIVENRITDSRQLTFSSVANWFVASGLKVNAGINASSYKGLNYKKIDDLLGGQHWLDIDQFAERDFGTGDLAQNDLDNPNRLVKVGDAFGYSYDAHVNNGGLWAVANYVANRYELYAGANYTYTEFWRHGNMRNGRFPLNSKGDSEKNQFHNVGIKAGATWKISGRHYLDANVAYITRAPFFRNSYIAVRTSDFAIKGLTSEKIVTSDINYNIRTPFIKARLTAYYTMFMDQSECRSFYDDNGQTFVNFAMKGIDKVNRGFELGAEVKAAPSITVSAAVAIGAYQYNSRPLATITKDNIGTVIRENEVIYIKNFFMANTPQTAAMLGINYAAPRYWYFGANVSYFDDMYVDIAPGKRTADVLLGYDEGDPARERITAQQKVASAALVDVSVGKTFRFAHKYNLNLNFQISNLLDKKDFRTGGFEQSRYPKDELTSTKFPPKYFYAFGRTFYLIVGFNF